MKPLRKILTAAALILFMAWLGGCKPTTPSGIIPPGEMTDLLYDYHLADAMATSAKGGFAKNVYLYREAVLRKYKVTQAEFDSSMVYYWRHADQLEDIYEDLSARLEDESRAMGSNAALLSGASGDSANVWSGQRDIILLPTQPYNVFSFDMKTDSTFHRGDQVMLSFNSDFIFQDGIRDAVVVLAVTFTNDSVCQRISHVSSSMPSTITIDDADSLGYKKVSGFFMLSKNDQPGSSMTTLQLACISNIRLFRLRPKNRPAQAPVPDRIPVNATLPDSQRMRPSPF